MPTDPNKISFTEFNTFAHCEQQWSFLYLEGEERDEGPGMRRGTTLHKFLNDWWNRRPLALPAVYTYDLPEDEREQAAWLIGRYLKHYGTEPPLRIIASELEFEIPLYAHPHDELLSRPYRLVGRLDHMGLDDQDRLWVVEDKSYGNRARLNYSSGSIQETLMTHAAREITGEDVFGVLFNGIYTYQWAKEIPTQTAIIEAHPEWALWTKAAQRAAAKEIQATHPGVDARPPAESFDRLWLDRPVEQIERALAKARGALRRQLNIRNGEEPIPNVGTHCDRCPVKTLCWGDLLGTEDYEGDLIQLDD